jgi:hypothetical protein
MESKQNEDKFANYDPFSEHAQGMYKQRTETKIGGVGQSVAMHAIPSELQRRMSKKVEKVIGDSDSDEESKTPSHSEETPKGKEIDDKVADRKESNISNYAEDTKEEAIANKPKSLDANDRSSGEQSTADEDRAEFMKRLKAELIMKVGSDTDRRFSTIDENRVSKVSQANRVTTNDDLIEESLGITKQGKIYPIVKKF